MFSHTDYTQYKLRDIADSIESKLEEFKLNVKAKDIARLCLMEIRTSALLLQRLDHLLIDDVIQGEFVAAVTEILRLKKNAISIDAELNLLHWLARCYIDTFDSRLRTEFNEATRSLLKKGIELRPRDSGSVFAKTNYES
jgi:hypothetical protein